MYLIIINYVHNLMSPSFPEVPCTAVGVHNQRRSVGLAIIKIGRLSNLPATILENSENYSVLFTASKNIIRSSSYR